ncbi:hypothetical protein CQA01_34790 [Cyclobacterium qasimii]|nr:hypothetical protein CQA01_34790 [Cyclobacterium qasimii]
MMGIDALSILWIAIAIMVVVGLFVALIFKADKVVELLKLDRGFDDDKIEIGSLEPADIIKIGTFIIGGLLILDNIPAFLSHTLFALKGDVVGLEYNNIQDKFNWAVSALNLIIGFLLITNYEFVAKILKTEKTEKE